MYTNKIYTNIFAVGVGDDIDPAEIEMFGYDENEEYKMDYYFKNATEFYDQIENIALEMCSIHVLIKINSPEYVQLGPYEVRYFKVKNTNEIKNSTVRIRVEVLDGQLPEIYASTSHKNPFKQNMDVLRETDYNEMTIDVPAKNADYLYVTLVSGSKGSKGNLSVTKKV